MAIKQNRKSSEKIKEEILSQLEKQPLSVEQIRKKIKDSNWSTINKYLEELKKNNLVREVISTDKIKIYQKVMGDTYFDLPITEEQRKKFHTLFSMILEEYKRRGKSPTKTHIAKCAVYAIDNKESGLDDLPIVWYLYGMMPLMAIDTTKQYQKEESLPHEKKVQNLIIEFIEENGHKKSGEIQKEQHRKYNEEMYIAMDNLLEVINKPKFENKEVTKWLDELFIACPSEEHFMEVFDLVEEASSVIQNLDVMGVRLQKYRKEIFQLLDALWKVIAIYKLINNILQKEVLINKRTLLDFYLSGAIQDRKGSLQEAFSELNSVYLNKLAKFDVDSIELSEEAKEVARIMEDFI